jgi:hypothetical protein
MRNCPFAPPGMRASSGEATRRSDLDVGALYVRMWKAGPITVGRVGLGEKRIFFLAEMLSKLQFLSFHSP